MARYKIGDQVISRPKSNGCAPAGSTCTVGACLDSYGSRVPLYEVITPDRIYRHYEDELEPLVPCQYCKKGKKFNFLGFGDTEIESYILGTGLVTEAYDSHCEEEDDTYQTINYCPFCGDEVVPVHDEEPEEVLE